MHVVRAEYRIDLHHVSNTQRRETGEANTHKKAKANFIPTNEHIDPYEERERQLRRRQTNAMLRDPASYTLKTNMQSPCQVPTHVSAVPGSFEGELPARLPASESLAQCPPSPATELPCIPSAKSITSPIRRSRLPQRPQKADGKREISRPLRRLWLPQPHSLLPKREDPHLRKRRRREKYTAR